MSENIRLSVIIPVYNAAVHLRQCLDSVLNQSVDSLEIICVDDGSTDASWEILQEYARTYSQMRIYQQENSHAGVARNQGMAKARGKFLHFLDADDWLEPGAYKEWLDYAECFGVDICAAYYYTFDDKAARKVPAPYLEKEEAWFGSFLNEARHLIYHYPMPWNKLYKRDFLLEYNIRFDSLICANDRYFFFQTIRQATKVMITHGRYVNYRIGQETSLIGKKRLQNYACHFRSFESIWKMFAKETAERKAMVLDVSMEDFFSFYGRARGTDYEVDIGKELQDYIASLKLEYLQMVPLSARWWYEDFLQVCLSGNVPSLVTDEVSAMCKERKGQKGTYIFPYHLFRPHERIIIYGAGDVGKAFYHQGKYQGFVEVVALADSQPKTGGNLEIISGETLRELEYDYVLIAVRFKHIAEEIREYLISLGLPEEKIKWDGSTYERDDFYRNAFYPRWQAGKWR